MSMQALGRVGGTQLAGGPTHRSRPSRWVPSHGGAMRRPPLDPRSRAAACWSSPRSLSVPSGVGASAVERLGREGGEGLQEEGTEQRRREGGAGRTRRAGGGGGGGDCRRARSPEGTVATRRAHPRRLATSSRPCAGRPPTRTRPPRLQQELDPLRKWGRGVPRGSAPLLARPCLCPRTPGSPNHCPSGEPTVPTLPVPGGQGHSPGEGGTGLAPTPESPFSSSESSSWSLEDKVQSHSGN